MRHFSRALHRHEILRSPDPRAERRPRAVGPAGTRGECRQWRGRVATGTLRLEPALVSLLHVGVAWGMRLDAALTEVALSPAEYCVLRSLVNAGEPLSLDTLADRAVGHSSNIAEVVEKLEADGLVDRAHNPMDARRTRVQLTALGRRWQAAAAQKVDAISTRFEAAMPAPDRAALRRLVSRLG